MNQKFDATKIPIYALKVARILINEGFDCYLVGGGVRDNLLGITQYDIDFTTNALPTEIQKLESFPKSVQINERFGTIAAIVQDKFGENHTVEITTYRKEEDYTSGRWPAKVEFGISLEEDLARRDFTINSMCIDMKPIVQDYLDGKLDKAQVEIIDLFGGQSDLENKIIKAVGNPIERFSEDGLRSIRAIRFASTLGLKIEPETYVAISKTLHVTEKISIERFRDEFLKIIYKSPKPSIGIRLLKDTGILKIFIPELLEGINVTQIAFHVHDVFDHSLETLDVAEDKVKIAALFHDIGKPKCDTHDGHFFGHDQVGAQMTKEILTRLHLPKDEVERNVILVREHMFYYPYNEFDVKFVENKIENFDLTLSQKEDELKLIRSDKFSQGWSDGAIRRFIRKVGVENIEDIFRLRIADATSNPKSAWDPTEIERLQYRISKVLEQDNAFKVTDLEITGNDLLELGFSGKKIGEVLNKLLELVMDDVSLNEKDKLIQIVKDRYI